jgi:hypothetical protein
MEVYANLFLVFLLDSGLGLSVIDRAQNIAVGSRLLIYAYMNHGEIDVARKGRKIERE